MAFPVGYPDEYLIGARPVYPGMAGPFGNPEESASSDGVSDTTSGTFQNKLTKITNVLPAGRYRVGWYAEGANTDSGKVCNIRVRAAGIICGLVDLTSKNPNEWNPNGGVYQFNVPIDAAVTMDIYWRQTNGGTARIRNVRLEIWRVS